MSVRSNKGWKAWLAISIGIVIIVGWLVYAAVFFHRINRGNAEPLAREVQQLAGKEPQEEWFAISQHGKRTGYSHTELRPQADGFVLSEELFLRLDFLGEIQEVSTRVRATLQPDFSLKKFTFRLQAGLVAYQLKGAVRQGTLMLVSRMAGREQSQQLPLSQPIYLGSGMKSFMAQQRLQVGTTYKLTLFDPATLSQTLVPLRVEAKETIPVGPRNLEAYRVALDFHGVQLKTWISPFGELLKEEGFLGLTMVRTERQDALEGFGEAAAAELVREAAVVPDRAIVNPRQLKRLRLRLTGVIGDGWDLDGGRQQWRQGELSIVREPLTQIDSVKIPVSDSGMARDLQPSLLIQSDDVLLKKQAAAIVGDEEEALRAVGLISSWVYHNLEKRPTLSIPNASQVYNLRAGDCNEHSVLFAALARAAGIPTRIAAGLLYTEGLFYYHAWDEVYVGEWIAVDPLLNQIPADPTHVRLIVGELDRQVMLVSALGRLSIKVIDYE